MPAATAPLWQVMRPLKVSIPTAGAHSEVLMYEGSRYGPRLDSRVPQVATSRPKPASK